MGIIEYSYNTYLSRRGIMKSNKIFIAALSLGLAFSATNTQALAASTQMTESEQAEFNERKAKGTEIQKKLLIVAEKYTKEVENQRKAAQQSFDQSKQAVNNLENEINKLKQDLSNNPEDKTDIENQLRDKESQLDIKKQETKELEAELRQANLLYDKASNQQSRHQKLINDYGNRDIKTLFDLDKIEYRYEVVGHYLNGDLTLEQRDAFTREVEKASSYEELENIKSKVANEINPNANSKENQKDPASEEKTQTPEKPIANEENLEKENAGETTNTDTEIVDKTEVKDPSQESSQPKESKSEEETNKKDPETKDPTEKQITNNDKEKTSPQKQGTTNKTKTKAIETIVLKPENQKIKLLEDLFQNPATVKIQNQNGTEYTTTKKIKEDPIVKKDTIELKEDLEYIKKGTHKISDLKAKRDKLEETIQNNRQTVRAISILEEIAPQTVAKYRALINDLLTKSQKLLKEADYALAEYNYLLSK